MQAIIAFIQAHEAMVSGLLVMGVNEIVRLLPGVESNSIVQLIGHLIGDLVDAIRAPK